MLYLGISKDGIFISQISWIFPHNYDHINEDIVFLEIDFDSLIVFCSISTLSSITEKNY